MNAQPDVATPKPIIQNFFGKPVRFFKADFEVEVRCRNDTSRGSHDETSWNQKNTISTYVVPLPDFAAAIGYGEHVIRRMIKLSDEVFNGLYKKERIPDARGHRQITILMAVEMCDMLIAKLHTSRIKNPLIRATIIQFQRNLMIIMGLIRRGKLRPVRFSQGIEVPPAYLPLLSLPPGRELKAAVSAIAEKEQRTITTIYRRLQKLTGENRPTRKGAPRRTRSEAGTHRGRPEYRLAVDYKRQHPKATAAQIRETFGMPVSIARINAWLREARSFH